MGEYSVPKCSDDLRLRTAYHSILYIYIIFFSTHCNRRFREQMARAFHNSGDLMSLAPLLDAAKA